MCRQIPLERRYHVLPDVHHGLCRSRVPRRPPIARPDGGVRRPGLELRDRLHDRFAAQFLSDRGVDVSACARRAEQGDEGGLGQAVWDVSESRRAVGRARSEKRTFFATSLFSKLTAFSDGFYFRCYTGPARAGVTLLWDSAPEKSAESAG